MHKILNFTLFYLKIAILVSTVSCKAPDRIEKKYPIKDAGISADESALTIDGKYFFYLKNNHLFCYDVGQNKYDSIPFSIQKSFRKTTEIRSIKPTFKDSIVVKLETKKLKPYSKLGNKRQMVERSRERHIYLF